MFWQLASSGLSVQAQLTDRAETDEVFDEQSAVEMVGQESVGER